MKIPSASSPQRFNIRAHPSCVVCPSLTLGDCCCVFLSHRLQSSLGAERERERQGKCESQSTKERERRRHPPTSSDDDDDIGVSVAKRRLRVKDRHTRHCRVAFGSVIYIRFDCDMKRTTLTSCCTTILSSPHYHHHTTLKDKASHGSFSAGGRSSGSRAAGRQGWRRDEEYSTGRASSPRLQRTR